MQAESKLAEYRHITINVYNEICDFIANDVAQGPAALNGTEQSQVYLLQMITDAEFISNSFGTDTDGLDDIEEADLPQLW